MGLLEADRTQEAATVLDVVLGREPEHADALHLRGVCHMRTGALGPAEAALRTSIAVSLGLPQQASASPSVGSSGSEVDVLNVDTSTGGLPFRVGNYYNSLGVLYQHAGLREPAVAAFRMALRANPADVNAIGSLSHVYDELHQPDAAVWVVEEGVKASAWGKELVSLLGTRHRS